MAIETSLFEGAQQHVLRIVEPRSGTRGFIVVDSTVLGPAMGGCRMWRYADDGAAELDARRLARGMSLKNAMAGLPLGGGKTVLQAPREPSDRAEVFTAFAHGLNAFAGQYLTAEDVGTNEADMEAIRKISPYVFGLPAQAGAAGGDPSPWTAYGVFSAIVAITKRAGGELRGARVAVQGLGNVGFSLCRMLHASGAELIAADVNERAVERAARELPFRVVDSEEIHKADATIFAPCALGGGLNERTIAELGAEIVVGAANNQLASSLDGERLFERGILYAPDYVVNAGGVINIAAEYLGEGLNDVRQRVEAIGPRLLTILDRAKADGAPTSQIADAMAREIIARRAGAFA